MLEAHDDFCVLRLDSLSCDVLFCEISKLKGSQLWVNVLEGSLRSVVGRHTPRCAGGLALPIRASYAIIKSGTIHHRGARVMEKTGRSLGMLG